MRVESKKVDVLGTKTLNRAQKTNMGSFQEKRRKSKKQRSTLKLVTETEERRGEKVLGIEKNPSVEYCRWHLLMFQEFFSTQYLEHNEK